MRCCKRSSILLTAMACCLAAACSGCGNGDSTDGGGQSPGPTNDGNAVNQGPRGGNSSVDPAPPEPAPPDTIPEVKLTEKQWATCLVRVGDQMPNAELPILGGDRQSLAALRGEKLTVVCFWRSGESIRGEMEATRILEDLGKDFAKPNLAKGVHVIGINEGDPSELAGKCLAEAEASFPNLMDPDGAYFGQVATEKLPRVYLLDPTGKILWFDIEFSRTTRRNLEQGISVALGELGGS